MVRILFILLLLTGCASQPKVEYVSKIERVPIDLPDNLLRPCPVSQPPSRDIYTTLEYEEKENILTNYAINLLKDLKNCNEQIMRLKTIRDQTIEIRQPTKETNHESKP